MYLKWCGALVCYKDSLIIIRKGTRQKIPSMLQGKKILFVSQNAGFSGRVERYLYQTANTLRKHGAKVYGAFFTKFPGAQLFQTAFDGIYAPDNLPEDEFDLACIHKVSSLDYHIRFQKQFNERATLFVHDHEYYCPRFTKSLPITNKGCDRKYKSQTCSICAMMQPPFTWKHGLVAEINEKITFFQDRLDVMRRYQHTVVLSRFLRDNLLFNGFAPNRLNVIFPYVSTPEKMPVRENTSTPMILFISQLDGGKNLEAFLKVLSRLHHSFQATIVGDGQYKSILERSVKKMNLEDKVRFHALSQPEDYYLHADIALIPLSPLEPYSLEVAECAAWGLPVVSSPSRGLAEALQNGINGFTESNHDIDAMATSVEKLLGAPELRQELGANGYKLIQENFSLDQFLRKFKKLLGI